MPIGQAAQINVLTSPIRGNDSNDNRQQMFSALQNPTGPPLSQYGDAKHNGHGIRSGGALSQDDHQQMMGQPNSATIYPNQDEDAGGAGSRSPNKRGNANFKNNLFIKVTDKRNDPHGLNSQHGFDGKMSGNQGKA